MQQKTLYTPLGICIFGDNMTILYGRLYGSFKKLTKIQRDELIRIHGNEFDVDNVEYDNERIVLYGEAAYKNWKTELKLDFVDANEYENKLFVYYFKASDKLMVVKDILDMCTE